MADPFVGVSIVFFLFWVLTLLFSKKTRREQLLMSIIGLLLAPIVLISALADVRRGPAEATSFVGWEDALFVISLFGLASVVYEIFAGRHLASLREWPWVWSLRPHPLHWGFKLVLLTSAWVAAVFAILALMPLRPFSAFVLGGLLVGGYVLVHRHDLVANALASGLLAAVLVFFVEQFFFVRLFPEAAAEIWKMESLSGWMAGSVPVEELLWVAVVGFAIGPLYEFVRQKRLK
ncbi:MAG TPA: lycopene cyclase domain-containing protein [Patescibacteria group bacterium]|nr:lycopene cyclase domain-containing protein [Patescibacteria group bacterium]